LGTTEEGPGMNEVGTGGAMGQLADSVGEAAAKQATMHLEEGYN
jgi:hypothetical protein